jgi:predicted phage terminase large subunit-like protein
LIEDKGSGSALIQNLRNRSIYVYDVLPVGDKVMRMSAQSAIIENGEVFLPIRAPWYITTSQAPSESCAGVICRRRAELAALVKKTVS